MITKVKRNTPLIIGENPNDFVFESHKYDVDIIRCYYNLEKILHSKKNLKPQFIYKEKKLEYLEDLKNNIEFYCKGHNINFIFHFRNRIPLIVPSTEDYYNYCLSLYLVCLDLFRINSFLQYQKQHSDDYENFLNLIEFIVCDIVKNQSLFINDYERLKTIMQWVELSRKNELSQQSKVRRQSLNKHLAKYSDQQEIHIDPNIIQQLYNVFSFYFNVEDLENLVKCLKGEKVQQMLLFKDSCIKLVDVFFRLKEKQKIIENKTEINNWICNNFLYLDKDKKPKEFDYENVKNILTGQTTISKRSRINLDKLNL